MQIRHCDLAQKDERGGIFDIVQDVPTEHVSLILSRAGSERGHHYHEKSVQYVYVIAGKLKALAQQPDAPVESAVVEAGDLVTHEPMESHAFIALEDSMFLVLTRGPRGGTRYEDDTYRLDQLLRAQ